MKVWLAESSLDFTTYIVADKGDRLGVFKMEMAGLFGNKIYDESGFYEQLSTDDKLLFVEKTLWLLEQLEGERKRLDDIKIEQRAFDVPEWLLLDDWNEDNEFDLVINTKTQSTFKFEYVDGKMLAIFINTTDEQCLKAKSFLDEMRKRDDEWNENEYE